MSELDLSISLGVLGLENVEDPCIRFLFAAVRFDGFINLLLLLCHFSPACVSAAVQSPDGEAPSTAEVDLFMSTQRIKVLNADTQVQK